jgi:hypothetical protein
MRPLLRFAERLLVPTEIRLGWERSRLDSAYAKDIAAARKAKDTSKVQSLEQNHRFEIDLHDEEEDEYITKSLLSTARRLRLPIPHRYKEDKTESDEWYEARYSGRWYLTTKGVAVMRDEIRRELKARHELRSHWVFWLTALTGVLGSLTGLVALLLQKAT